MQAFQDLFLLYHQAICSQMNPGHSSNLKLKVNFTPLETNSEALSPPPPMNLISPDSGNTRKTSKHQSEDTKPSSHQELKTHYIKPLQRYTENNYNTIFTWTFNSQPPTCKGKLKREQISRKGDYMLLRWIKSTHAIWLKLCKSFLLLGYLAGFLLVLWFRRLQSKWAHFSRT